MQKKKEVKRKPDRLVPEAIKDLNKEIIRIRKERTSLNLNLRNIDSSLENARDIEKKLEEKIAELEAKEAKLKDKAKRLKQKADSLGERLSKVRVIKEQLGEV